MKLRRSHALLFALVALVALPAAVQAAPIPELGFISPAIPTAACTPEAGNAYEVELFQNEGWAKPDLARYGSACKRLKFVIGPILVKPGQNDVLATPLIIEKPAYDGYITRFDPDLVEADGTVPPIEQLHLHHATWLSEPSYAVGGPFMAAGEEKTIFAYPRGYGLPVSGSDVWYLEYMVHSAVPTPTEVFITYDIDFVAKDVAEAPGVGLKPAYPLWLDVGKITRRPAYPTFNAQRGFGTDGKCTWPAQTCANFDPYGLPDTGQGQPGNGKGVDFHVGREGGRFGRVPNFQGGTLIWLGGHLHPGGLTNDIDLVRGDKVQRIYTGEAKYWDRKNSSKVGGPPTSWDFSMTKVSSPQWGVHIEPGDILRSNATYDTAYQSVYEAMGIAVAIMAPDTPDNKHTAPGVDPFSVPFDPSGACNSGGLKAAGGPTLCDKGIVSHGHMPETSNFGNAEGELAGGRAGITDRVDIAGFLYTPGDLTMISMTGVPTVPLGKSVTFTNADVGVAGVLHTVTSCAYPCTGPTGTAFPLADGRSSTGKNLDFDSSELGFGPALGAAKNEISWTVDVSPKNGFEKGARYTYFCRIHPSMRGAFEVV